MTFPSMYCLWMTYALGLEDDSPEFTMDPKSKAFFAEDNSGLGTPFFSVQNVLFFFVLKRERYVLFCSFLKFLETYETQKNVPFFSKERKRMEKTYSNVLLQRTEKNGKNASFFLKERKRTRERFVLLQKERENVPFFFRDIYRNI